MGESMPGYVIANVRVQDPGAYEQYRQMVPAIIERFGGRYLVRGGRGQVVEGDLELGRVIVLEFPSYEDAQRWYCSPEYAAAKELRQGCAAGDLLIVEGA
jgi:uncharacterized protein (DUF1330 family)